jgi:signal transduction histidine kinase
MGDRVLVRQLIMVVLDNALKFTPAGGRVALDVSAPGGRATIVVRDSDWLEMLQPSLGSSRSTA